MNSLVLPSTTMTYIWRSTVSRCYRRSILIRYRDPVALVAAVIRYQARWWRMNTPQFELHQLGVDPALINDALCSLLARGVIRERWVDMPSGGVRVFAPTPTGTPT